MKNQTYLPPLQAFRDHAVNCLKCKNDAYGFCALGFRLLGETARMREKESDNQLELLPAEIISKAATRIFLGHKHGPKFFRR